MRKLYFVDSIYVNSEPALNSSDVVNDPEVVVSLIALNGDKREGENEENVPIMVTLRYRQLQYDHRGGNIREGWYVYYNDTPSEGELYFSYASSTALAQEQIRLNNKLREQLLKSSDVDAGTISDSEIQELLYESEVRSYHVNVGHGNCSLILIKNNTGNQIWMIDCSIHEKQNKRVRYANHLTSLNACLQQVAHDAEIDFQQMRIDRFFLTHMHYDHYNGMKYLIDNGYIDQSTICYINLKYQMASKSLNSILERMVYKGINKIVEPLTANGNPAVQILYPECPICRSKGSAIGNCRIVKNVNDSSSVIRFNLGMHTMVCPGDIEQKGLNAMYAYLPYPPYSYSDIYVVSHHGSFNGHPSIIPVLTPPFLWRGRNIPFYTLFLGRDGAYNGIFSDEVKSFFNTGSRLITTDASPSGKPLAFVMIDWRDGNVTIV